MPVQQMITMVMTSAPFVAADRHVPCGDQTPMAPRREPNRRRTPSPGASPGRARHRCAQSVSGSAGWCWSSTCPQPRPSPSDRASGAIGDTPCPLVAARL